MTLVEALTRLAAAVATMQVQLSYLGASGMTPEQQVQFSQALADIATIKAQIDGLTQQVAVAQQAAATAQPQLDAVVAQAQSAAAAHASLRDEVDAMRSTLGAVNESVGALRTDVDALKAGVGDLSGLPALPSI